MTIKALKKFTPEWFTPLDELESENETKTRFKITGLTGSQQAEVAPEIEAGDDGSEFVKISARAMFLFLKYGLLDWEGLEDDSGPVRFSKSTKVNQDNLPYKEQAEIAARIFELTFAPPEDKKKSASRPK